jgi:integrase
MGQFSSGAITLGTLADSFLGLFSYRLKEADQGHHATIWGRTGSGKSRLPQSLFVQHLGKNKGVGLIEPHHDLSFDTLSYLMSKGFFDSDAAYTKLVYLDWASGYVPFNVLAGGSDPHPRALNALDAMMRVWPELEAAPLFQALFLSSLMALIANNLPIVHLHQFLTDADFRHACLSNVSDPLVHQQFRLFDKLNPRDHTQEAGSTLRRAYLFSFSPYARLTLGQPENWLDFRRMMDEGTCFIINLGNINDSETCKLIGAFLMVQIEQAALSRTDLEPSQRRPFTLLVDEWPAFAAQEKTIAHILSQTRKFKLRLYLAAQSLSQVGSSNRLVGALENCRLSISFGLGRVSAEIQSRSIAPVDPYELKEEAPTDTQHGQYRLVEPKSATSKRTIAIPASTVGALHQHRERQHQERLLAGEDWADKWGLVFTTAEGAPLNGTWVTHHLQKLLAGAGLPRQRFHDLRHARASFLLVQGVSPRVVMETLGHSQISLTMNTYSHVMPALQRDAAERMDALLAAKPAQP